jgi:hypothetical protein
MKKNTYQLVAWLKSGNAKVQYFTTYACLQSRLDVVANNKNYYHVICFQAYNDNGLMFTVCN